MAQLWLVAAELSCRWSLILYWPGWPCSSLKSGKRELLCSQFCLDDSKCLSRSFLFTSILPEIFTCFSTLLVVGIELSKLVDADEKLCESSVEP